MPLVPTDDTTGVAPAFWTPSVTKSTEDHAAEDPPAEDRAPEIRAPEDSATADEEAAAPEPVRDPHPEPEVNPTADTQSLHHLADAPLPVFLDTTGRRRRRVRALLWLVSLAGLTYATVLVLSLLSGHSAQSLGAPEYRPDSSPAATGAPVASAQAQLPRTDAPADSAADGSATDGSAPGDRAPAGTAPAAQKAPARSPAAETVGRPSATTAQSPPVATPGPSAPAASAPPASQAPSTPAAPPSPSGGIVEGLLDTLFPWAS